MYVFLLRKTESAAKEAPGVVCQVKGSCGGSEVGSVDGDLLGLLRVELVEVVVVVTVLL